MSKLCIHHYNARNIISIIYLAHQSSSLTKPNLDATYITHKNVRIINNFEFNCMSKSMWYIIVYMQMVCFQIYEKHIIIG